MGIMIQTGHTIDKQNQADIVCKGLNLSTEITNDITVSDSAINNSLRLKAIDMDDIHKVSESAVNRATETGISEKEMKVMKIILLGAPGAGKGTQGEVISEVLSIPTVSTGNMIREALKSGTSLGNEVKSYVESGKLVPDELVINMVKERTSQNDCKNGFILDGFPRTIPQAEALDKMGVDIDKVLYIDVPDEAIVERMSGRRVCEKCGSSYNLIHKQPKKEGVCDLCAGTLVQRKDDHPDTVKERLNVYHKETEPLKDYYEKQNKLIVVDGQGDVKEITNRTLKLLGV